MSYWAEITEVSHQWFVTLGNDLAACRIFFLWLGSVMPISLRSWSSITLLPYGTKHTMCYECPFLKHQAINFLPNMLQHNDRLFGCKVTSSSDEPSMTRADAAGSVLIASNAAIAEKKVSYSWVRSSNSSLGPNLVTGVTGGPHR